MRCAAFAADILAYMTDDPSLSKKRRLVMDEHWVECIACQQFGRNVRDEWKLLRQGLNRDQICETLRRRRIETLEAYDKILAMSAEEIAEEMASIEITEADVEDPRLTWPRMKALFDAKCRVQRRRRRRMHKSSGTPRIALREPE